MNGAPPIEYEDIPVCSVPRWQVLRADAAARAELVDEVRQAVINVDGNADATAIARPHEDDYQDDEDEDAP